LFDISPLTTARAVAQRSLNKKKHKFQKHRVTRQKKRDASADIFFSTYGMKMDPVTNHCGRNGWGYIMADAPPAMPVLFMIDSRSRTLSEC
jgi:hypothetical protein